MAKIALYVIGALAVAGGGAYAYISTQGSAEAPEAEMAEIGTQQEESAALTLAQLMAGASQVCTFATSTAQYEASGTAYVDRGRLRVDSVSVMDGRRVEGSVIVKDGASYAWTDLFPQGIKVAQDEMAGEASAMSQGSVDINASMDYNCTTWPVDESVFELPAGVEFRDMGAQGPAGL